MLNLTVVIHQGRLTRPPGVGAFVALTTRTAPLAQPRPAEDRLGEPAVFQTQSEPLPAFADADLGRPVRGDETIRAWWRREG